ncbi:MAG: leucyl/phenylalanyl-tRNA--protein transferase [Rhodospirillaceae bacterium]|nr:leucyl/phenylalanyl-tRNA--protein transferase [Rhodospirillaceae bacterium]
MTDITPELVLKAYAYGVFPMAKSRGDSDVFWVQPKLRGVLPLDAFHTSRSLRKRLRQGRFTVTIDQAFDEVMAGCAEATDTRADTWINDHIIRLFTELHKARVAHSIEVWKDGMLAGGLYGLAMGAAFFGESMFSRATDASKVALCHLVGILKQGGFLLLDTQFITDHLRRFGAIEMSQQDYLAQLSTALASQGRFAGPLGQRDLEAALFSQRRTQIS